MSLMWLTLPPLLRNSDFRLFWLSVAFSEMGARATAAANLWQVQELTDSVLAVGLVSLCEGIVVVGFAPIGGVVTDRVERRRVLQGAQVVSLLTSALLALTALAHLVTPTWVYTATSVVAAASVFDMAARQSLIPALAPRERIMEGFGLIHPVANIGRLVGPAIAGVLIAAWGAAAVYVFDVITRVALVVSVASITFGRSDRVPQALWSSVLEGFHFVRGRPLIWQFMALDFVAVFFAAYRVLLPALARDVFLVGVTGYGFLSAAPALGGIVGAGAMYRLRKRRRKGLMAVGATALYALCAGGLGTAPWFALAVVFACGLGFFDSAATTIRQAVTQMETPNRLRGRVTSLYHISARGGPTLGQAALGALAAVLGAPLALGVGSGLALICAAWIGYAGTAIREYEG